MATIPFQFPVPVPSGTNYEVRVFQSSSLLLNSRSMAFDGNHLAVGPAGVPAHNFSTQMAVSAWFKFDEVPGQPLNVLMSHGASFGDETKWQIHLLWDVDTPRISFLIGEEDAFSIDFMDVHLVGTGSASGQQPLVMALQKWHNIIFTYDGTQSDSTEASNANVIKGYFDGLLGSGGITPMVDPLSSTSDGDGDGFPTTMHSQSFGFIIGGTEAPTGTYFGSWVGNVDEVALWTGTINQAQALQIYNKGCYLDLLTLPFAGQLVSWYRCGDGDSGITITDVVSGHNLSVYEATGSGFFENDARSVGSFEDFLIQNATGIAPVADVTNVFVTGTALHFVSGNVVGANFITGTVSASIFYEIEGGAFLTQSINIVTPSLGSDFVFPTAIRQGARFELNLTDGADGLPGTANGVRTFMISSGSAVDVFSGTTESCPELVLISGTFNQYTLNFLVNGALGDLTMSLASDDGGSPEAFAVTGSGPATFLTTLIQGDAYTITVSNTGSTPQECTVSNGTSVINDGDVLNVTISCEAVDVDLTVGRFQWLRSRADLNP